jgi:hypothetical protein
MEWFHFNWFDLIALGLIVYGGWKSIYRLPLGMNPVRISAWYAGLAWTVLGIVRIYEGRHASAAIDAGLAAYEFYRWWNSGGGDGVKNFLQSLVMKPAYAVR